MNTAENFMTGFKRGVERDGGKVEDVGAKMASTLFWCASLLLTGFVISYIWNSAVALTLSLPTINPFIGLALVALSHLLFHRKVEMVGHSSELSHYLGQVVGAYFAKPLILLTVMYLAQFIA